MAIAKVSCKTCKSYNENKINGKLTRVCTLKVTVMNAAQSNCNRSRWVHYSGAFTNPNACVEWNHK